LHSHLGAIAPSAISFTVHQLAGASGAPADAFGLPPERNQRLAHPPLMLPHPIWRPRNSCAFSAGSHKGSIHPYALDLLRKLNYDVASLRSNWAEFSRPEAPTLDFVFTLCDGAAAEVRPVWPGQPMTAHWGLPDPATEAGKEAE
jgi:hypothetical protein